jgi:hypothetical protein
MSYIKYYLYKEQVSYDRGITWQDTGNQAPSGDPIGTYETYEQCTGVTPTGCTCDAFSFNGTNEGNNTYRIEIQGGENTVTAATWYGDCGDIIINHTEDTGFTEIVSANHWEFTNNRIKLTANTNPTTSVREGHMTVTYTVDGNSCTKAIHLVQTGGTGINGKYQLTLHSSKEEIISADCDSTSAITMEETQKYSPIKIIIGDCVTNIGDNAFSISPYLTTLKIGYNVRTIENQAFDGACNRLNTLTIPDNVTTIGDNAFHGSQGGVGASTLRYIIIGSGVTSMAQGAFAGHMQLYSITIKASTPPALDGDAFYDTNNCPIYVPSGSVEVYKAASGWSIYASRIRAIS